MSAKIEGIPQLRSRLEAITPNEGLMKKLALSAIREQKKLAPRKTGNLARSIQLGSVSATAAETIATADYAAAVETGTRPHEIRPRRRKALRWMDGGRPRFAKRVQHPGTRAQPFMLPGAKKALEDVGLKAAVITSWNDAA